MTITSYKEDTRSDQLNQNEKLDFKKNHPNKNNQTNLLSGNFYEYFVNSKMNFLKTAIQEIWVPAKVARGINACGRKKWCPHHHDLYFLFIFLPPLHFILIPLR